MHCVINKLTLSKPFDDDLFRRVEQDLLPQVREREGFVDMQIVRLSDTEVVLLVHFATREALDEISRDVAAPWFAEHVRPYLSGPVQRSVGEVAWRAPQADQLADGQ